MAKWNDLAKDNRLAAYEVFVRQRWRTCVSRTYYAIYSAVTEELIGQGVVMPKERNNPSHAKLPTLVGHNLAGVSHAVRWRLSGLVANLYKLRLMADYMPQIAVEKDEARVAIGLMEKAYQCLGDKS